MPVILLATGREVNLFSAACSGISLCNLCVLCVSVVWFYSEFINHRDTEDAEVAQRRARSRLFVQSPPYLVNAGTLTGSNRSPDLVFCPALPTNSQRALKVAR